MQDKPTQVQSSQQDQVSTANSNSQDSKTGLTIIIILLILILLGAVGIGAFLLGKQTGENDTNGTQDQSTLSDEDQSLEEISDSEVDNSSVSSGQDEEQEQSTDNGDNAMGTEVEFEGTRSDWEVGVTYYVFKTCDESIPSCTYYIVNESFDKLLPILKELNIGDEVEISGDEEDRGAAAGSAYVELTGNISITLL